MKKAEYFHLNPLNVSTSATEIKDIFPAYNQFYFFKNYKYFSYKLII